MLDRKTLINELKTKSMTIIAMENNVHVETIRRWIKKYEIQNDEYKPAYQNKEWLLEQINNFNTVKELCDHYNFNEYTVKSWCRKYNIQKDDSWNQNYFKDINTEVKAYLLGFLMADGCISKDLTRLVIDISKKDKIILEIIQKELKYNKGIHKKNGGFNTECFELIICSKKMCKDLIYHGIVPRKSGKETLPNTIPNNLIRHFIRGYMDGDGCIIRRNNYASQITLDFSGMSYNIFYSIHNFFIDNGLLENNKEIKISKEKNSNCLHLQYYSKNANNILNFLYKDSHIYLERKYLKFINCPAL